MDKQAQLVDRLSSVLAVASFLKEAADPPGALDAYMRQLDPNWGKTNTPSAASAPVVKPDWLGKQHITETSATPPDNRNWLQILHDSAKDNIKDINDYARESTYGLSGVVGQGLQNFASGNPVQTGIQSALGYAGGRGVGHVADRILGPRAMTYEDLLSGHTMSDITRKALRLPPGSEDTFSTLMRPVLGAAKEVPPAVGGASALAETPFMRWVNKYFTSRKSMLEKAVTPAARVSHDAIEQAMRPLINTLAKVPGDDITLSGIPSYEARGWRHALGDNVGQHGASEAVSRFGAGYAREHVAPLRSALDELKIQSGTAAKALAPVAEGDLLTGLSKAVDPHAFGQNVASRAAQAAKEVEQMVSSLANTTALSGVPGIGDQSTLTRLLTGAQRTRALAENMSKALSQGKGLLSVPQVAAHLQNVVDSARAVQTGVGSVVSHIEPTVGALSSRGDLVNKLIGEVRTGLKDIPAGSTATAELTGQIAQGVKTLMGKDKLGNPVSAARPAMSEAAQTLEKIPRMYWSKTLGAMGAVTPFLLSMMPRGTPRAVQP